MISRAKSILLRAMKIDSQNIDVLFHLSQVYFAEKNYENARQLLEDAYTINPNTEIANMLAKVYFELKEYDRAYVLFSVVSLVIPQNIGIILSMAKCKLAEKDFKTAKEHAETALKILPESEEAKELLDEIEKEAK